MRRVGRFVDGDRSTERVDRRRTVAKRQGPRRRGGRARRQADLEKLSREKVFARSGLGRFAPQAAESWAVYFGWDAAWRNGNIVIDAAHTLAPGSARGSAAIPVDVALRSVTPGQSPGLGKRLLRHGPHRFEVLRQELLQSAASEVFRRDEPQLHRVVSLAPRLNQLLHADLRDAPRRERPRGAMQ